MKVFKKSMNAVAAVENCILVVCTPADTGSDRGKCFFPKSDPSFLVLYRGTCGRSLCTDYLNGCSTCMPRRRTG